MFNQEKKIKTIIRRKFLQACGYRLLLILCISMFILFLMIVSFIIFNVSYKSSQRDRINGYDEIVKVANIFSSIFISATFVATGLKYAQELKLSRKKSGHDFLVNTFLGRIAELRQKLKEIGIDPYRANSTEYYRYYYDCVARSLIEPHGRDELIIQSLLNNLEYMCLAVFEGIIDEQMARNSEENLIFIYWRLFYPYIQEIRDTHYQDAWIYIDIIMRRWKPKEYQEIVTNIGIFLEGQKRN